MDLYMGRLGQEVLLVVVDLHLHLGRLVKTVL
jgi:hypothetical protein